MISNKFSQITEESDTKILSRQEIKVAGFDVLHEEWIWDGIKAQSYIFYNEDIQELSESELLKIVGKIGATYKKGAVYTFVNFDFKD